MLQIENPQPVLVGETEPQLSIGGQVGFVFAFLRRRYLSILIFLLPAIAIGALYLFAEQPTFTASATMMMETRRGASFQQSILGDAPPDFAWLESQIEIVKSASVASYVVKQQRLAEDSQFVHSNDNLFDRILRRLGIGVPEPNSDAERLTQALMAFNRQLNVRRLGPSYLLTVSFRSHNSEQAVKIANAMVDAYIFDQLNAKYQANRRAGDWLQERLQNLREQAASAERAVIEFKAKNNIVSAGGALLTDKDLSDMNGQLTAARAHTVDVQVRLKRIDDILKANTTTSPAALDETVSEALTNPIITKLQSQYLDLVNREADWSTRYGQNHAAVVSLRNQIRETRKSMLDELRRIAETYRSEYDIAIQRQMELEKRLASMVSQSRDTNQAQIGLFSLEATAQSYRRLYDNFLQRSTETAQQQTFPITEARLVSPAFVTQTEPRPAMVWLMAVLAGMVAGVGFGVLREFMDGAFRTRGQVKSVLGTECLAMVPLLPRKHWKAIARPVTNVLGVIGNDPLSSYVEAIRSIKLTVDLNNEANRVIGLTSCFPSEGKSTLAAATAALMAQSGARVLLVDCDLRNPSLSRALAPDARVGFLEVAVGGASLADAIRFNADTNLAFLPTILNASLPNPTEILASDAAKSLFAALTTKYDYVIVDLSPIAPAIDVRASSRVIGAYILVIEWGDTKVDDVQYALRHAGEVRENIIGAVLNKVDLNNLARYDSRGAKYSYSYGGYARN
jgi:succinoglycan biosynthesis transport protein ExoP